MLLVATDRPETVITFCALLRMGAIPVPVSTMYRAEELGELLRDSRARMVVATPSAQRCRTATSREVFQGEWLRTGDTYTRSADGFYTCLGRSNDMIKASGIWVSPMEVEGRLLEHPSVAECAVVGHRNAAGPGGGRRVRGGRAGAVRGRRRADRVLPGRALPRSNVPARCWRWTPCPRPPPARSSASWCVKWSPSGSASPESDRAHLRARRPGPGDRPGGLRAPGRGDHRQRGARRRGLGVAGGGAPRRHRADPDRGPDQHPGRHDRAHHTGTGPP